MKTIKFNLTSLALTASVLLAGACATDLSADKPGSDPGSTLTQLSNGPDLPEECNACWDAFQDCFAQGNDLAECGANIVTCTDACQAPPPPAECLHCAAGFDACVTAAAEAGGTGEDCAAGFEGCLFACASDCANAPEGCLPECDPGDAGDPTNGQDGLPTDGNCEPTEPPPIDPHQQCEVDFNQCFDDLWQDPANADNAAQICDDLLGDCFDNCPPDDGTGGGGGIDQACAEDFEACLNEAANSPDEHFFECEEILWQCQQSPDGQDPSNP
jgi:hypothetical protein